LVSLDLHGVDCTSLSYETDLFGPWAPYHGSEKVSALKNYLSAHNEQRCIIFMNEFEKTKDEVRRALLVPFGNGESSEKYCHWKANY
jgi:MoxR-like ATPase